MSSWSASTQRTDGWSVQSSMSGSSVVRGLL
jgi:hypothetical protein